jgi:UDP-N-acetylmuramoylalanine--D-glutamate ligase
MKAYPKKTRFAVWGFGVTGIALTEVLSSRGYNVTVIEDRSRSKFPKRANSIVRLEEAGVKFHFGAMHDLPGFVKNKVDVLSPSPGIKIPKEVIEACEKGKTQIAGEIEIATRLVQGKIIAVTGTDGKTTVASLIHHILKSADIPSHLVGNIGSPLISLAGQTKSDHFLVVEVSSYQLESVRLFRPYIAVVLNIAEDHLERHGDMRTYIRMKGRVFDRQRPDGHAVINFDDPGTLQAYGQAKSQLHGFSLAGTVPNGAWRENGNIWIDEPEGLKKVLDLKDIPLLGEHNQANVLATILACRLAGCPVEKIASGIISFMPLPHRIEPIGEIQGVLWVNDSKATNVHSTISALQVFDRPIILLLGGYEKNLDLTDMVPFIRRHAKHVVLMGETRARFRRILRESGYSKFTVRKTLQEACAAANGMASRGDVILLSPASSSFDQFKSYIERGEAFRKWVAKKLERRDA